MPERKRFNAASLMSRRQFIATLASGFAISFVGFSFGRLSPRSGVLRPPGAIEEKSFLSLCTRCGGCVLACPNSALHLQGLENGVINLLTPKLVPSKGYCIMPFTGCQECIEACPVKVLQPLDLEGISINQLSSILKIGTALLDTDLCISYTLQQPCLACKEVCPVDGAITTDDREEPRKPVFDQDVCVGCGACEYVCPTTPKSVIISDKGAKRKKRG